MNDFELPDRYLLQGRLGGGSYGDVYLGLDRKLNRKVAIKLMKGASDPASLRTTTDLFRREAKLLALLDHVHVVKVFDYDVAANGALFLVMEYLDGRVVSDMPLPLEMDAVSQFVSQIGSALQTAHDRGLIHRDLKPGNVMYVDRGDVDNRFVLLDLGIAKLMNAAQAMSNTMHNMTFTGHGTPLYMAPEQIEERDVDARTDVYAFGSTLFELLSGSTPFGHIRGTHYSVIKAVMTTPPRRLSDVAPQRRFPEDLEDLIDECLRKEPAERPATMRLVVERFQTIVAREKNAQLEAERRSELELLKATVYPAGRDESETLSANGTASSTIGPDDDLYPTLEPRQFKHSSGAARHQWSDQPRPDWLGRATKLLLVLSLFVAAIFWWNWKRQPPPVITISVQPFPDQRISEEKDWTELIVATLPDSRVHPVRYSLGTTAPDGVTIDSVTGRIRWRPTEAQGPGIYPIEVQVESPHDGVLGNQIEFNIQVDEVNTPPQLGVVNSQLIAPGDDLDIVIQALDFDIPKQPLAFSLGDPIHPEAHIDQSTGRLKWTPKREQLGHDFHLVVRVSDADVPQVSPVESKFSVTFLEPAKATFPDQFMQSAVQISLIRNSLKMEFVLLEPGEFQMGSPKEEAGRQDDEFPHTVQLTRRLLFGRHEVTVGQFARFVADNKNYKTEAERSDPTLKSWRNAFPIQDDDFPVVNVSWNDAQSFCEWLSKVEGRQYRLPTEAEWEYACRAGTSSRFFSGNEDEGLREFANLLDQSVRSSLQQPELAVPWDDTFPFTAPVGEMQANAFGICDLSGNVWEWCGDRYAANYFQKSSVTDPTGPESGDLHVVRGGSWLSQPRDARSATRDAHTAKDFQNNIGFRVVRLP